jgi:hypothetical protein
MRQSVKLYSAIVRCRDSFANHAVPRHARRDSEQHAYDPSLRSTADLDALLDE